MYCVQHRAGVDITASRTFIGAALLTSELTQVQKTHLVAVVNSVTPPHVCPPPLH
jgi:hypothetical protein